MHGQCGGGLQCTGSGHRRAVQQEQKTILPSETLGSDTPKQRCHASRTAMRKNNIAKQCSNNMSNKEKINAPRDAQQ